MGKLENGIGNGKIGQFANVNFKMEINISGLKENKFIKRRQSLNVAAKKLSLEALPVRSASFEETKQSDEIYQCIVDGKIYGEICDNIFYTQLNNRLTRVLVDMSLSYKYMPKKTNLETGKQDF